MTKDTNIAINNNLSKIQKQLIEEYKQAEQDEERQKLLNEWDQI